MSFLRPFLGLAGGSALAPDPTHFSQNVHEIGSHGGRHFGQFYDSDPSLQAAELVPIDKEIEVCGIDQSFVLGRFQLLARDSVRLCILAGLLLGV